MNKCLGASLGACFQVAFLQTQGFSKDDAYAIRAIHATLTTEARPDIEKVMEANAACILAADRSGAGKLRTCATTYERQVSSDPRNVCNYTQTFVDCETAVFQGCGALVARDLCLVFQASVQVNLPYCHTSCASPSRGEAPEPATSPCMSAIVGGGLGGGEDGGGQTSVWLTATGGTQTEDRRAECRCASVSGGGRHPLRSLLPW